MVEMMAEAIRSRKRELLRQAESISIALDDRGEYRLVRFRCDCPLGYAAGNWANFSGLSEIGEDTVSGLPLRAQARGPLGVREGVLCVLPRCDADSMDLADLEKDHSDVMKESVLDAIRAFCTPLGCAVDHELEKHILQRIYTYTADGGSTVQKCGMLLKAGLMPNISLLMRDTARTVCTSTEAPAKLRGRFGEFWSEIFDKRHALVPDIQHSDAWQELLLRAQKHILQKDGRQGGGLNVALKHLGFAKQRFDSASAPARKYCCMLSAIVILLIAVAGDEGKTKLFVIVRRGSLQEWIQSMWLRQGCSPTTQQRRPGLSGF